MRVKRDNIDKFLGFVEGLEKQILKAKNYLDENDWLSFPEEKRKGEFKFQKDVIDSLLEWTKKYSELTGMADFYKRSLENKGKKKREGSIDTGFLDELRDE